MTTVLLRYVELAGHGTPKDLSCAWKGLRVWRVCFAKRLAFCITATYNTAEIQQVFAVCDCHMRRGTVT